ncbi:MAG: hypothetical protein GXO63_03370 [Candidatus Micrarchaeota archaeon]|nr:hypothetical protein [Candidatus Micrarchaeota archaeon]
MGCVSCGDNVVGFRWVNLIRNGDGLFQVNLSSYCLRCGNKRSEVLRRTIRSGKIPELLPNERI